MTVILKTVRLYSNALIPTKAHSGDAGLDLYAREATYIPPNNRTIVGTGIALEIPKGYCGLVTPRSGLAYKNGVTVLNTPGLIDSGYRGEISVILQNFGNKQFDILPGDRIAQLVISPYLQVNPVVVQHITSTERGGGGFGSSGK